MRSGNAALSFSRKINMPHNGYRDKTDLEYGKPEGHTLLKDRGDWFEPSKMAGMKKGKLSASLYLKRMKHAAFFFSHQKHGFKWQEIEKRRF